jgi:hypothetical protein
MMRGGDACSTKPLLMIHDAGLDIRLTEVAPAYERKTRNETDRSAGSSQILRLTDTDCE